MSRRWHEWLCKSHFSFLCGASSPQQICERAQELGYRSLALSDFDGVYGLARLYREVLRAENPFALHYGVEVHTEADHDLPVGERRNLVLIAQSAAGYHEICRLLTHGHKNGGKRAIVSLEDLTTAKLDEIAIILPMRGFIRREDPHSLAQRLAPLKEACGKDFYCAFSRHLHPYEDSWLAASDTLRRKIDARPLLCQDAFFAEASDKAMSDVLHAIRTNGSLEDSHAHYFPNCERHLHRIEALEARFSRLPFYDEAWRASEELAESCVFSFAELRYCYPKEMIPEGHNAQSYLEALVWEAARTRYKEIPAKLVSTLSHELDLISQLAFADYFLTVWDIVRWARGQDILCQGRGSAANSAVCFVLGITAVDPTLFDLLFERFVSMERGDPPDIDVDFEHERREEVIQYIYQRYGRRRAAMVANVITFRRKGALRAVGKVLGIEDKHLNLVSRACSSKAVRAEELEVILEHAQGYDEHFQLSHEQSTLWCELTRKLKGFPRHLGIHSGGFMLSERSLEELVVIEPATMEGRSVVQWSKDDIEALGFFKIDILALGMLSALRKSFAYIQHNYGVTLELSQLARQDDPATYAMIQRADTVGTFQIESRAQMSMLPRLKPRCFYDLVIEVAIIRPGPIQGKVIHPYLARREGKEPITFPDERLRPILARTLGIAIFQEQAMRIAITVGNFSAGEANELRKNIGAWGIKDHERDLNPWLKKLADGLAQNHIPPDFAEQILGQMRGFAEYGFPESHAVSFALIAYASSYVKCHYPAEFFAGVLNAQPMGFYSPHSLLQAARRDGVPLRAPCVQHSTWDHSLEAITPKPGEACRPPRYALRIGLRLVVGLREAGAQALIQARNKRSTAWEDFSTFLCDSLGLSRPDLCALAAADAFSCFDVSRSEALWQAEAAPFSPYLAEAPEETLTWKNEEPLVKAARDLASFQAFLGEHPSQLMRQEWPYALDPRKLASAKSLNERKDSAQSYVYAFGLILFKQAPGTAKGMVFVTLEDETGFINLAFRPQVYRHFARLVEAQSFLCVRGLLQKEGYSHSILVSEVLERQTFLAPTTPLKKPERTINVPHRSFGHRAIKDHNPAQSL